MSHVEKPTFVQIEPVGQCNLRCTMCSIQFREDGPPNGPPAFMDFELYTRILDRLSSVEKIHLQGLGEPLMHPRFPEMIAYAKNKGIYVTTNSNLTLLNPHRAEKLVAGGLDEVHISIDGANPETYENIRVGGRYDRLVWGIENLIAARSICGSDKPVMKVVMVIMRQNLSELPGLIRQASDWGMVEVFVQHLSHDFSETTLPDKYVPMRDFVEDQNLMNESLERIERYFDQGRQAAREAGIRLRLPRPRIQEYPPGTPGRERCDWPWYGPYISYDGHTMPCCMVSTPDRANFGSIREEDILSIWEGDGYANFRRQLDSGPAPEICQACSIYKGTF